ncbi:MAG TPA: HTTM domain-containing protein, partial [Cytophagaceae bacterium]|nr:HTTM domain-containing protein [Cytophagaceae bacterium]
MISNCTKAFKNGFLILVREQASIAPLVILRITFGVIMVFSVFRFMVKGWVTDFYVTPKFYFTFYGFEWVKPLGETGMFVIFYIMALAALLVLLGLFYRISITTFFLCFTYTELIDKTYYLNHYYFISLVSFLLILVPANRYFSLDVLRKPKLKATTVPAWTMSIFKLQLFLIYFFAGLSKINYDWIVEALPLKIWLPANSHIPFIGLLLTQEWVAYLFSWFGLFFDLFIGFILWNKATVKAGYFLVVIFHLFTAYFFKIGMFPYIMISMTIVFFSAEVHLKLINSIRSLLLLKIPSSENFPFKENDAKTKIIIPLLIIYFVFQLLLPVRYLFYPGNLLWTEEGYRFSWRVMLMEKAGTTFFYVKDSETGNTSEIINSEFLSPMQENMMSTQPDMILQYAHFLKNTFHNRGIKNPIVTVESYVTLNGSGSRLFIDKKIDL